MAAKTLVGGSPPASLRWIEVILVALAAVALYASAIGLKTINPAHLAWLLHGDSAQHYLGWQFFRNEPWSWPLGRIVGFGLPEGTSIAYTDSIPLLALPLKLLSPLLPGEFQYFGLWMLLCFILNGYFALRLLARVTDQCSVRVVAACFFVVSPPLLLRSYGHESLMAHWLIVAGLDAALDRWSGKRWSLLVLTSALCHPYLLLMTLALAAAAAYTAIRIDRVRRLSALLLQATAIAVLLIAVLNLAGYFAAGRGLAAEGYGYFSMNVLSLVDPLLEWSRFIRQRPIHPDYAILGNFGQYEGFLYLGAGMILLTGVAFCLAQTPEPGSGTRKRSAFLARNWPLVAVAALFWGLALSNKILFSDLHLLTIPLPDDVLRLLSVFRASGRLGWIAFYLINFIVLANVIKYLPARAAFGILLAALALQVADQSEKYKDIRRFFKQRAAWQTPLQSPQWKQYAGVSRQLLVIAPHTPMQEIYLPFADLAARHQLPTNAAYLARGKGEAEKFSGEIAESLARGDVLPQTLYVFAEPEGAAGLSPRYRALLQSLDGYTLLPPQQGAPAKGE